MKYKYDNPQQMILAHMNEVLKLKIATTDKDLIGLCTSLDNIGRARLEKLSQGDKIKNYGPLLSLIVLEKLHYQFR